MQHLARNILLSIVVLYLLWATAYPFLNPPQTRSTVTESSDNLSRESFLPVPKSLKRNMVGPFGVFYSTDTIQLAPQFKQGQPIPDFANIAEMAAKKSAYFEYIVTRSEQINRIISIQRQFLLDIQDKRELTSAQTAALTYLKESYRVKQANQRLAIEALLLRVDIIPPEFVAIQSANESGWGTSRFARRGYNFFGLWCYRLGCGFVPKQRNEGAAHEVAKFNSLPQAMYRYKLNLNRNRAYASMRQIRAQLKANSQYDLTYAMFGGLEAYSERGDAYIEELRDMLAFNRDLL